MSEATSPRLSAIVVTYNEQDVIGACLEALVPQLGPGDELIIADNASADRTLQIVRAAAPQAIVIEMPSNDGYMPACNAAARSASGELLLLIDADAEDDIPVIGSRIAEVPGDPESQAAE